MHLRFLIRCFSGFGARYGPAIAGRGKIAPTLNFFPTSRYLAPVLGQYNCEYLIQATDKKGTIAAPFNPKFDLKGLRNNGGPTQTIALQTSSPAVDKGSSVVLTGNLTTDQRGAGFPRTVDKSVANANGGDGTDIGAFELGP